MTEAQLHKAVAQYLDLALPADAVWHHSPMQGHGRGPRTGAILKSMGARAGWPDITIIYKGRAYFIELKVGKRGLSAVQEDMVDRLRFAGVNVGIERSVDDVEQALEYWGIPLKARAA